MNTSPTLGYGLLSLEIRTETQGLGWELRALRAELQGEASAPGLCWLGSLSWTPVVQLSLEFSEVSLPKNSFFSLKCVFGIYNQNDISKYSLAKVN